MLEHHIQKTIVQRLAKADKLRFADLQPGEVENKLFTYHLKITIRDGFVCKSDDGLYSLTPEGRIVWQRVTSDPNWMATAAHSVLFLVVRRESDGAWLLYKRLAHPLKDKVGFVHVAPRSDSAVTETASDSLVERTGLRGDFAVLGSGYFRVYDGENLESFTHFDLLVCDAAVGELVQKDPNADFIWVENPDFTATDMIPNMQLLSNAYFAGKPFFMDETIRVI